MLLNLKVGEKRETDEKIEMIRRKPSPISACDESMFRVVTFDSTQTQGSSKYFLFTNEKPLQNKLLNIYRLLFKDLYFM